MVDKLPERDDRQLVAGFAIDLERQSTGGGPVAGSLELEQELEDPRAGRGRQRVGLRWRVVGRREQRAGVLDRVLAAQDPIRQVEPPAGAQLALQPRLRQLARLDRNARKLERLDEPGDRDAALGNRGGTQASA